MPIRTLSITLPTADINHTALFKRGQKEGDMKEENFKRQYYTTPSGYGKKNLQSREHDEVISRAVKLLNFTCQFETKKTRRSQGRYVTIKRKVTDDTEENQARLDLQEFIKKYRRHPDKPKPEIKII